jgi:dCMP deaminase
MRKPWDKFFLDMAQLCAEQSTCLRRSVGAVIVKDKAILSTGFNGAPSGLDHCEEIGCLRQIMNIPSGQRHEICRGAHAEQNAINNAAKFGVRIEGATLYCTTYPCSICARSIVNSGITKVIYVQGYPDEFTANILRNIEVTQYKDQ